MEVSKQTILIAVLAIAFISGIIAQVPSAPADGHKYDLEIQKVLLVNDTDYVVFEGLKVKRFNKTFYVADGSFTMNVDFDETWKVEANVWRSKLGNNQWELTAFRAPLQLAPEFIENVYMERMQGDLAPFSNLPVFGEDDPKIFPKGKYTITNYIADVQQFPPALQDGTYRVEIFLTFEGEVKTGFVIFWKVYPEVG